MKKDREIIKVETGVSKDAFEFRMDFLEVKMEQIERKVANKADEIVSMQVLQHRQELEDIYETMQRIDGQIKAIDRELTKFAKGHQLPSSLKETKVHTPSLSIRNEMFGT